MASKGHHWSIQPTYDQILQAVEFLNAGFVAHTADRRIVFANERALELLGYTAEELDGRDLLCLFPEEIQEVLQGELEAIGSGDLRPRVTVLRRKDGRTFSAVSSARAMQDENGVTSIVSVFMDLAEVQTAKRIGSGETGGMAATLERIAGELRTLSLFTGASAPAVPHDHPDLDLLSDREREILVELLGGSRAPAIAKKLHISPHTVRNHLKSMFRKLEVPDQAALIERVRALAAGSGG